MPILGPAQYDVSTYFSGAPPSIVDEELRLKLAGKILLGIALIAVGVFVAYALHPENEALVQIFELVKNRGIAAGNAGGVVLLHQRLIDA